MRAAAPSRCSQRIYFAAPLSDVVVDMTGFDPGTWDMLLVRERT